MGLHEVGVDDTGFRNLSTPYEPHVDPGGGRGILPYPPPPPGRRGPLPPPPEARGTPGNPEGRYPVPTGAYIAVPDGLNLEARFGPGIRERKKS